MNKMLIAAISAGLMLSACSSMGGKDKAAAKEQAPQASVEQALQECKQTVGETADRAAFDACMKSKGFERPAAPAPAPAKP
ncbi:hypothetical protein [Neisseria canis]|uniref:Lipoprotein n=1 Tax=Neisseria canis TaxID=493 RepID=A0A1X3D036_9NEIS|nr:hypothetical protein [Neisseria canis]OSI13122.1 hypothetical protein BWD07_02045 [Neisseria canis]VEF00934.1 Uncharacterised protein [Neisseria canis]